MRWVHESNGRYYQAHLIEDLFGDWTLITVWGALGSKRGGMRSTAVPSRAHGLAIVEQIAKRRSRRGYRLVSG
jgi:hypothetical protein